MHALRIKLPIGDSLVQQPFSLQVSWVKKGGLLGASAPPALQRMQTSASWGEIGTPGNYIQGLKQSLA